MVLLDPPVGCGVPPFFFNCAGLRHPLSREGPGACWILTFSYVSRSQLRSIWKRARNAWNVCLLGLQTRI